jgi:hypothetical protein
MSKHSSPRSLAATSDKPEPVVCSDVAAGMPKCCSFVDYLKDTPVNDKGEPASMTYGAMAGIGTAVFMAVGAAVGAAVASEKRGMGALVGALVGTAVSGGTVAYYTKQWRDAGGTMHRPGACVARGGGKAGARLVSAKATG